MRGAEAVVVADVVAVAVVVAVVVEWWWWWRDWREGDEKEVSVFVVVLGGGVRCS